MLGGPDCERVFKRRIGMGHLRLVDSESRHAVNDWIMEKLAKRGYSAPDYEDSNE